MKLLCAHTIGDIHLKNDSLVIRSNLEGIFHSCVPRQCLLYLYFRANVDFASRVDVLFARSRGFGDFSLL